MPGGGGGSLQRMGRGRVRWGHGTVLRAAAAAIARSCLSRRPGSGLAVLLPGPEQRGLVFEPRNRPCRALLKLSRVDVFGCSTKL